MIQFSTQYEVITKIWQSFQNGKKSERVRISKEDLDYAKIHFNSKKFENYTIENFISVLLYVIFNNNPVSKTDFLNMIKNLDKNVILKSLNFKSKIINSQNTLENDFKIINKYNLEPSELYFNNRISLLGYYVYYKNNPNKLKGRIAKKEFKKINILLSFFDLNLEEIKWQ
jgi:hypothetical protein